MPRYFLPRAMFMTSRHHVNHSFRTNTSSVFVNVYDPEMRRFVMDFSTIHNSSIWRCAETALPRPNCSALFQATSIPGPPRSLYNLFQSCPMTSTLSRPKRVLAPRCMPGQSVRHEVDYVGLADRAPTNKQVTEVRHCAQHVVCIASAWSLRWNPDLGLPTNHVSALRNRQLFVCTLFDIRHGARQLHVLQERLFVHQRKLCVRGDLPAAIHIFGQGSVCSDRF